MSPRRHRLAPALIAAAALGGCCIRPPSSVDAVPGGWINLADLPAKPSRGPDGVGESSKPKPKPSEPSPAKPSLPVATTEPTPPVPVAVPTAPGGQPSPSPVPPAVAREGEIPGLPKPANPTAVIEPSPGKLPRPLELATEARPSPASVGGAAPRVPTLGLFGADDASGRNPRPELVDRPNPAGRSGGPSLGGFSPATLAGSAGASSLPEASRPSGLPVGGRSPSLSLGESAASDAGNGALALRRVGDGNEPAGGEAPRLSPELARPSVTSVGGAPRLEGSAPPASGLSSGAGATLPGAEPFGRESAPFRAPSLGLFSAPDPSPARPDNARIVGLPPANPSQSPSAPPAFPVAGAEAPGQVEAADPLPVFGGFKRVSPASVSPGPRAAVIAAPRPAAGQGNPSFSTKGSPSELAVPGSGSAAPVTSAGSDSARPRAVAQPPSPAGPGEVQGRAVPLPRAGAAAPVPSDPPSSGTLSSRPPAGGTVAFAPDSSPAAPLPPVTAASDDAELARRRLEALREEMAGYEREAERLRALLRRALGLEPAVESPDQEKPGASPAEVRDPAR